MAWKEEMYKDGVLEKTVRWPSIGAFWNHVAQFEEEYGNAQVKKHWKRTPYGYRSHWFDGVGRWDVVFKVEIRKAETNPRKKKPLRKLADSTLVRKARQGVPGAQRELGRRGLGLTGKRDSSLCGYCGSSEPMAEPGDWAGGAQRTDWPHCPDCGGV
jgi:hypothetical protein